MKASNKNRLQKIEITQNSTKKPIGKVVIYNPKNPKLDQKSCDAKFIIAIPDNGRAS